MLLESNYRDVTRTLDSDWSANIPAHQNNFVTVSDNHRYVHLGLGTRLYLGQLSCASVVRALLTTGHNISSKHQLTLQFQTA